MAQRTVGTKLEVSGEADYKKALSSVNRALGVLNAEMKKTSAEFKGNENSVEALTKKHDLLERTLLTQQDKVNTLREALQHAADTYGESSATAMQYQKSLYLAEAEVTKTEQALRETEDALKDTDKAMDETGGSTGKLSSMADALAGKLGIQIPDGARKALAGLDTFSTGAVAAVGAVGAAVTAVIKITKELSDLTLEAAGRADEIMTESMISGLSTDTVQKIQYASELIDVSYSTINGSLTKLTSNMAAAKDGSQKQQEAFQALGVTVTNLVDGSLRSAEDVFYDVIDALGNIENATERDAASMDIFGKSAKELNPIILQGSSALKEYMEEAEAAGYVMDNNMLEALGNVDDAYQRLQLSQEAVKNQLAAEFAPAQEKVFTDMRNLIQTAGGALVESGLVRNFGLILENLLSILGVNDKMTNDSIPALGLAFKGLSTILGGVALAFAVISDALDAINAIVHLDFSGLKNAVGLGYGDGNANNFQRTKMSLNGSLDMYDSYYGRNSTGNVNWQGGWTRVGENGPENVYLPRGTRIDNAQESRLGGGDTYVFGEGAIQINASDVQEFNDVVNVFRNARVRGRMA